MLHRPTPSTLSLNSALLRVPTVLACALLLFGIPCFAQVVPQTAQEEGDSGGAASETEPVPVPSQRANARATMSSFLSDFTDDNDLSEAVACLDLSESGLTTNLRATRGRELAIQLKGVIDRIRFVDLEEISDDPSGQPFTFATVSGTAIRIAPTASGEWLFTAATVAAIPSLFDELSEQEVVEGVLEAPPTAALWLRSRMPESLRRGGFILETWQWLGLGILIILGLIVDRIVTYVLESWIGPRVERAVGGSVASLGRGLRPFGLLAMSFFWSVGILWLGLPDGPLVVLHIAIEFLAISALIWAAFRAVDVIGDVFEQRASRTENKLDDLLVPMVKRSVKILIVAFGLVFLADNLDVSITSLLAGVGLGGIAFALAAQDVVKNLFGALTILLDRPFDVGDWIVIGSTEGVVEQVNFRSTRIRTFYNSMITLPNANLISAAVDNYGRREYRRWSTRLSIAYETPPEKIEAFCEGIRELIRLRDDTRKDGFYVYLNSFGDSALEIMLYMFFDVPDWDAELAGRHGFAADIIRLADRLEVEFAYPTRRLLVESGSPLEAPLETAGSRTQSSKDLGEEGRRIARSLLAPADD